MSITINNYETYLIDYLDGKLTATEVAEVLVFLERHPEIKETFDGVSDIHLDTESIPFDVTPLLKPGYTHAKADYEPLLVGALEGDLTAEEQTKLEKGILLYPELTRDKELFALTLLTPDQSVVFTNKQQLKKGNVFVLYRNTLVRMAAILLMASLIGVTYQQFQPGGSRQQSNHSETVPPHQTLKNNQHPLTAEPTQAPRIPATSPVTIAAVGKPIVTKHPKPIAAIETKDLDQLSTTAHLNNPILAPSKGWLNPVPPQQPQADKQFISLRTLVQQTLNTRTKAIEQKTRTAIDDMNKTAGVNIKKDSTGKITHVEIGALGFAWSK
jgi:hypothetical protein